jgi:ketosteroid isomerase-like protein
MEIFMNAETVVRHFVEAINRADIGTITTLMTENHRFIDAAGVDFRGRERMREGWVGYFALMPDYRIEVQDLLSDERTVLLTGQASGTYAPGKKLHPENHWRIPAAWCGVVEGEQIDVWQVYANMEPILQIMRRCSGDRKEANLTGGTSNAPDTSH